MDEHDNRDRNPKTGVFLPGHRYFGPAGNPVAHRMNQLRTMAVKAQKPEDVLAVFASLLKAAVNGDVPAAKVYLDFIIGRPIQKIELTGADGEPIGIRIDILSMAIFQTLQDYPEAQTLVALTIQRVAADAYQSAQRDDGDNTSRGESCRVEALPTNDDGELWTES